MAYAEVSDIEARWRELSTSEQERAAVLIEDASAMLDSLVIVDDTDEQQEALLKTVCCSMVIRAMSASESDTFGANSMSMTERPSSSGNRPTEPGSPRARRSTTSVRTAPCAARARLISTQAIPPPPLSPLSTPSPPLMLTAHPSSSLRTAMAPGHPRAVRSITWAPTASCERAARAISLPTIPCGKPSDKAYED